MAAGRREGPQPSIVFLDDVPYHHPYPFFLAYACLHTGRVVPAAATNALNSSYPTPLPRGCTNDKECYDDWADVVPVDLDAIELALPPAPADGAEDFNLLEFQVISELSRGECCNGGWGVGGGERMFCLRPICTAFQSRMCLSIMFYASL